MNTGLRTLLSTGDLPQHPSDDGTADASTDELKQRVCNCRREIREVSDSIDNQIGAEPHQKTHDRTDLEALHDRRGSSASPDRQR